MQDPMEPSYPLDFRSEDAMRLGEHLRHRDVVELVGAKRIGISNFLRFFLYHKEIVPTYISKNEEHIFIPVDLNDLVERNMQAFWTVVFKRLVDTVEISITLPKEVKEKISNRFLTSIQLKDLFMTLEEIRNSLIDILKYNLYPTIFFIRFDRLTEVTGGELFANLQGLRQASDHKLSYVFTSYRPLESFFPEIPLRESLSVLSSMYLKPAQDKDMQSIFRIFEERYHLNLSENMIGKLIDLSGGHVQYLQLSLIILNEKYKENIPELDDLHQTLVRDERISLLSEEIWESLTDEEKNILMKIHHTEEITADELKKGTYLWESGILAEKNGIHAVFSPLFDFMLQQKNGGNQSDKSVDFTKKEHMLFTLLEENLGEICDREKIIASVWPEYAELGVSDWTIDRLIARLRTKLKLQNNHYTIVTVKTRGYRLVKE